MSKIAVLDSWVDPKRISPRRYEHINLCRQNDVQPTEKATHGTMCAIVLDRCTSDYELINIQITPNYAGDSIKTYGSVDVLAEALDLCAELDVDIISMSAVTSLLSDSKMLYEKVKALSKITVIVAALDNAWYVTVPTSYPFVIGVQNDSLNLLGAGEIACQHDGIFGTDVVVNCTFEFLRELGLFPSNSLAVPVVTAYINKLLNSKSIKPQEVFTHIKMLPAYTGSAALYQEAVKIKKLIDRVKPKHQVPYIYVSALDNRFCIEIMDWLFENDEAQSCALVVDTDSYDVRLQVYDPKVPLAQQLWQMEWFYKTDAVFVCDPTGILDNLPEREYDAKMFCDGERVTIEAGGERVSAPRSRAAKVLNDMFDENED